MPAYNYSMNKTSSGFTIVELLIVIVIIALLAAISIVAYTGVTARADFSKAQSDIRNLDGLVKQYYALNGSYPNTSGSWRYQSSMGNNFIPGLVPDHASSLPQDKVNNGQYSYVYRSDGTDYKILRHTLSEANGGTGLPTIERTNNPRYDAVRSTHAWGYWTSGAASW